MSEYWKKYFGAEPDDMNLNDGERLLFCPDCKLQTTIPKC